MRVVVKISILSLICDWFDSKMSFSVKISFDGRQIVWKNVIAFIFLHSSLIYGAYRLFTSPPWMTMLFAFVVGTHSGLGITAGAHRLWSHRAYKAKLPLRIFLAFLQTMAGQVSLILKEWRGNLFFPPYLLSQNFSVPTLLNLPLSSNLTNLWPLSYTLMLLRMIFTNGVETIECITSFPKLTQTHITLIVASFLLIWAGCVSKNIHRWSKKAKQ